MSGFLRWGSSRVKEKQNSDFNNWIKWEMLGQLSSEVFEDNSPFVVIMSWIKAAHTSRFHVQINA